jgi:phosphoribosylaminoimidazolecarboxamide formyltransferase/IMP cyclohydrolase
VTGALPDPYARGDTFRSVAGGFLLQSRDDARLTAADLKIVTRRQPTDARCATCCSPSPWPST